MNLLYTNLKVYALIGYKIQFISNTSIKFLKMLKYVNGHIKHKIKKLKSIDHFENLKT